MTCKTILSFFDPGHSAHLPITLLSPPGRVFAGKNSVSSTTLEIRKPSEHSGPFPRLIKHDIYIAPFPGGGALGETPQIAADALAPFAGSAETGNPSAETPDRRTEGPAAVNRHDRSPSHLAIILMKGILYDLPDVSRVGLRRQFLPSPGSAGRTVVSWLRTN